MKAKRTPKWWEWSTWKSDDDKIPMFGDLSLFDETGGVSVMEYWRDRYGKRSNEFIEGVIAGATAFAIYIDGRPVVGSMCTPLKEAIKEIKEQLGWEEKDG